MAGLPDNLKGPQSGSFQPFSHHLSSLARPTAGQFTTSDSAGTSSSQYSIPHHLAFEDRRPPSTSSFESNWSNFQANGGSRFIPIEQYRSLQARYDEMHQEYVNIMKDRVRLEAKNSVLKEAYEHLLQRVPVSCGEHIVLKREDYPNITYWFRHEYISALADNKITLLDDAPIKILDEADDDDDGNGEDGNDVNEQHGGGLKGKRGKGRASQGQNVKMRYVQHENGEVIDGWRATDIRRYARSICVGFAMQGKIFHSWVEGVDAASRTSYYRDMVARFPEVGLCELDWKCEQIASEIYSQWRSSWVNKQDTDKTKTKGLSKRSVEEISEDPSCKKMKSSKSKSIEDVYGT